MALGAVQYSPDFSGFEYWFLGVPGKSRKDHDVEKDCVEKVQAVSKKYCEHYRFQMPELRVGTLDQLLTASVDLERFDARIETVLHKIIHAYVYVVDIKFLEDVDQFLVVNGTPIPEYLCKFKWDRIKFEDRQSMKGVEQQIENLVHVLDQETKKLYLKYESARTELALIERSEKGSLLTRNISEFVKKEDFVHGSEHLITVLVVVPKLSYQNWYDSYERLDNEVVPRSTSLLHEDADFGLFNVTLFKRSLANFKEKARDMMFQVRDFVYDKERIEHERNHLEDLKQTITMLVGPLLATLKHSFSEIYIAHLHVKTSRVFVECVLRYGLPPTFAAFIMIVPKRNVKKLRDILYKEFSYLDGSLTVEEKESKKDKALHYTSSDYFPYVSIKIGVEFGDFKQH